MTRTGSIIKKCAIKRCHRIAQGGVMKKKLFFISFVAVICLSLLNTQASTIGNKFKNLIILEKLQDELTISKIEPSFAMQGSEVELRIIGKGFNDSTGVGFEPIGGILIKNVKNVAVGEMRVGIKVDDYATCGKRDVIVSSQDGKLAVLTGGLTITPGLEPPPDPGRLPNLISLEPNSGKPGTVFLCKALGANFRGDEVFFFLPSSYDISFSPQGEQCGFEDHDYMIEPSSLKKMKDSKGCHGITWTEKCIVGVCMAEKKHKGDHRFDFRDCTKHKAKTPQPKMFCTTAEKEKERNKYFNDLYAEITGASIKASGVRVDSVRHVSPNKLELKITILPEAIPKMLDLYMSNTETFCDSAMKVFEIKGDVVPEESMQKFHFPNETEFGDGYYRISGEWQKENLPNWEKIPLDINGNPVNENWCIGSSITDGKAICFPGNELVVAGGGKVMHLPWDNFTNAMRFGRKAPQGQCIDDREFAQVTEYGTPQNCTLYYNSQGKETQILFVADIEGTVQGWLCKNVMWSKNGSPRKMNLRRFVLTHLTLP